MIVGSVVSILAFYHAFGDYAQAFSPFIALGLAFALAPIIAKATGGKYYIAREDTLAEPLHVDGQLSAANLDCVVCSTAFERPDMAGCPFHEGAICSLCCSLDKRCHDVCKTSERGGNGTAARAVVDLTLSPTAASPTPWV